MNDQQFDRVTLSLRKSWSRQGTRELREYVLGLQAQRDLLVQAVALLREQCDADLYGARTEHIETFLASIDAKVAAHQAQGTGAMPKQTCRACNNQPDPEHPGTCSTCHRNGWDQASGESWTAVASQSVVTPKFDTNSQAHVYKFGTCWNVACKDGNHSSNWATKEAAETWARENGYGIVSK